MPRTKRGYAKFTAQRINEANPMMLGVKLGRICVAKDIPVIDVAEFLGLSRTAVYKWFVGEQHVSYKHIDKVEALIAKLS